MYILGGFKHENDKKNTKFFFQKEKKLHRLRSIQSIKREGDNTPFLIFSMKIYNSVGCTIDGIDESELEKFQKAGWMTEEEYKKQNPEEFK